MDGGRLKFLVVHTSFNLNSIQNRKISYLLSSFLIKKHIGRYRHFMQYIAVIVRHFHYVLKVPEFSSWKEPEAKF